MFETAAPAAPDLAALPSVLTPSGEHKLHNYYEPSRFFLPQAKGKLESIYRQRTMIATEDFLLGFQMALESEVGDAAGEIMYRCGFEWGKQDIANFIKRMDLEFARPVQEMNLGVVLEEWWWPLQVAGWGAWKCDMTHRKEGLVFVDLYDSAVAKTVGNIGKVACHYYAGMFAAVFGALAGRELSGIEIQCYSMGEEFCKFLIGSSKRINAAQFWVREGASAKDIMAKL